MDGSEKDKVRRFISEKLDAEELDAEELDCLMVTVRLTNAQLLGEQEEEARAQAEEARKRAEEARAQAEEERRIIRERQMTALADKGLVPSIDWGTAQGRAETRTERADVGGGMDVSPKGADAHRTQNNASGGASRGRPKRKRNGTGADWTRKDALEYINAELKRSGWKVIAERTMLRWSSEGSPRKSSSGVFPWWGNQIAVIRWCGGLDFPNAIKRSMTVPYNDDLRHGGL